MKYISISLVLAFFATQNIQKYETPIQVWQTWGLAQTMWNCIAYYHPTALNAITKADPDPHVSVNIILPKPAPSV